MGAEDTILEFLSKHSEGASISNISAATGHTRATTSKYLEMMKLQSKVDYREVGKAKLWILIQKRKKILIAEDEGHIRRLIRAVLSRDSYDFAEAKDGAEALEKVSEEMPDLIILDLMMPKMDGLEASRQLKKNALTRRIPIIMLTAKGEMADKVVGIRAGADDYLTKPFEPRELRVRVRTFLDKEKRERNRITNLPVFDSAANKLKGMGKNFDVFYLFFKNLEEYKKHYGFSKTNELIRLTSQIIAHCVERSMSRNLVSHDEENNFIVAVEGSQSKVVLKEIKEEFEATIPFFYDVDYEDIDLKNDTIIKSDRKGVTEKIPLIQLNAKQLKSEDAAAQDLMEKLRQMRNQQ